MNGYAVALNASMVVLAGAGGTAALTAGWVFPWLRKGMFRPRLWGYGLLVMAAAFALQLAGGLLIDDRGTELRFFTTPAAIGFVTALALMTFAQVASRDKR
ncbi:hypothetical protein [Streptomyces sp. NPDC093109]|uniref:hypothetical protein n=1 Tax=Streptomyces sp. NPDC093109 TaxID=3154977 RepID=UPI00344C195F